MGLARDRWEHNLAKIKRQAKFDREQKKLQEQNRSSNEKQQKT